MSKNGSDKDKDDKWDLWLACQRNSSEAWIIALSFFGGRDGIGIAETHD
jgi:hypothetical protein